MNSKLLTTACIGLSLAAWAGCTSAPPTTLVINPSSTSSGDQLSTGADMGTGGSGAGSNVTTTVGSGAGNAGQAQAYFEATVYPDLVTTCGPCHAPPTSNGAPQWLGSDAADSYAVITNYPGFIAAPDNSILVSRGSIAHTGPAMTPSQLAEVKNWLNMEVAERHLTDPGGAGGGGGGSPAPMTLSEALDGYGQCMDYNMWQNPPTGSSLDNLPNMQTDEGVPCRSCHSNGLGGNWLSNDSQMTFNMNQKYPYVLRQVTGTVDAQGNFKKLVPSHRWIDKGSENCDPNYQACHPKFTLSQSLQDGINSFVDYTIQQFEQGNCGAGGSTP
ncbi:MAG TPA: hypothetical protein VHB21_08005 [Minicystis sp.]|nr:hypothetical protein [Minicystis sp.]